MREGDSGMLMGGGRWVRRSGCGGEGGFGDVCGMARVGFVDVVGMSRVVFSLSLGC